MADEIAINSRRIVPSLPNVRTILHCIIFVKLLKFTLRQEFKDSIEQKQVATKGALRQQQLIEARKAEAQQKIETARGDAESVRIAAEAQAQANRLLAESLTPAVIQ